MDDPKELDITLEPITLEPKKLVITLGVEAAEATRSLAEQMAVTPPEAVRRGLSLLQLLVSLSHDEELCVRDKNDGMLERIRFQWSLS